MDYVLFAAVAFAVICCFYAAFAPTRCSLDERGRGPIYSVVIVALVAGMAMLGL